MMHCKKLTKVLIASALALSMVFQSGLGFLTVFANETPQNEGNHFGAIRSIREGTDNVEVVRVRVVDGAAIQHSYRDTVYADAGNYYTTLRNASVTDSRLFVIETRLTANEVGNAATFLDRVNYTFGGIDAADWLGHPGFAANNIAVAFDNPDNRFIIAPGDEIVLPEGVPTPVHRLEGSAAEGFVLVTEILFRTPFDRLIPTHPSDELQLGVAGQHRINVAYTGYPAWTQHRAGARFITHEILGTYDLSINVDDVEVGRTPIKINFYDDFHTWDEIDAWAQALQQEAAAGHGYINGRYVSVQTIGYTWSGRPIWNVVVAESRGAVINYLGYTRPMITENPAELRDHIEAGNHDGHKQVIYFGNNHPDEVSGVDAQIVMIEDLLRNDQVSFTTVTSELVGRPAVPGIFGDDHSPARFAGWQRSEAFLVYDENPEDFEIATVTMDVDDILGDLILAFTLTTNPDGRAIMQRSNAWMFDVNRDNAFQTTIENHYLHQNIAVWSPSVFSEFHGHHQGLLIEPCTGPHNPNFERDLMIYTMLRQSHAMGRAAISGSYNHFQIPVQNRNQDWDDGGLNYTPVFLMAFGILGYTIEIPHANQDSSDGNVNIGYAIIHDTLHHFDEIFTNRMEILDRGVRGYDNLDADIYHTWRSSFHEDDGNVPEGFVNNEIIGAVFPNVSTVNPDTFTVNPFTVENDRVVRLHPDYEELIGRPRRDNDSFFPNYFVLPVGEGQSNLQAAYDTLDMLARHDVRIDKLTKDIYYNGRLLPEGSYVINMNQALRGYANAMLNPVIEPMGYTTFYAEGIAAFPTQRNFVAIDVREEGLLAGSLEVVFGGLSVDELQSRAFSTFGVPTTPLLQRPEIEIADNVFTLVKHNSDDAIRLVNRLLANGNDVWLLTDDYKDGRTGDFVVRSANITPQILSQISPNVVGIPGPYLPFYGQITERTATINPNIWVETMELPLGRPGSRTQLLTEPNVALMGGTGANWGPDSYARFILQHLEFNHEFVTPEEFAERADEFTAVINLNQAVTEGDFIALQEAVRGGIGYVGISTEGMATGRNILINTPDAAADETSFPIGTADDEAVHMAAFNAETAISARYNLQNTVYMINSAFFTQGIMPEANVLIAINGTDNFVGGFMMPADVKMLAGNVVAVTAGYDGTPVTLFGSNIFNRAHNRQLNVMMANTIFFATAGIDVE